MTVPHTPGRSEAPPPLSLTSRGRVPVATTLVLLTLVVALLAYIAIL